MRIDPDPAGPELVMLSQYLDYQRETMLSKTEGLARQQLAQQHPPSQLTLAGLLYHLSLVEEDWMEVRFAGLPDREPWASVDWESDPDWGVRYRGSARAGAAAKPLSPGLRAQPARCVQRGGPGSAFGQGVA